MVNSKRINTYSVRNDSTGFAMAAFIAWRLTVNNAILIAAIAAEQSVHRVNDLLNASHPNARDSTPPAIIPPYIALL